MQIDGANPTATLGERIQRVLRSRYSVHAAKQAARITGADVRTARSWVEEGKAPQEQHLRAIIQELGRDALIALFSPEIEQHADRVEREINDLREKASRLEASLGKGRPAAADQMDGMASEATHDPCVNQDRYGQRNLPERRIIQRRKDDC